MKDSSSGFTLLQVLVGLLIVGFLAAAIMMVIVWPQQNKLIKYGNETSAVSSLRLIASAELDYNRSYPERGYACSLAALGDQSWQSAIPPELATGHKAGYTFEITHCTSSKADGNGYILTAVPEIVGKTGDRGFCMDENNSIKSDPAGGTDCTNALQ
jgi:type IV pilus assembly protein PilA